MHNICGALCFACVVPDIMFVSGQMFKTNDKDTKHVVCFVAEIIRNKLQAEALSRKPSSEVAQHLTPNIG